MNVIGLLLTACMLPYLAQPKTIGGKPALNGHSGDVAAETSPLPSAAQLKCTKLETLTIANTSISSATPIPENSLKLTSLKGVSHLIHLPAICRVQGVLKPTSDSNIKFEVWMPISDWNGRFEQVGNGGYAGVIATWAIEPELRKGFAVASTDDGHTSGKDQSWAIGHPEKVIDFGYRAVHLTSKVSKTIIQNFYSKAATYSYFNGVSDGGREALMEAQRYPDDFNGIIAGAPASFWTHITVGFVWNEQAMLNDPASYIPTSKRPLIKAKVLDECDALDGVKDGVLEDPRRCHFDPVVLQCKGADGPDCLTAPQVDVLRKIHAGPREPRTGKQIAPGFEWPIGVIGNLPNDRHSQQFSFANQFFADMVFEDPKWDYRTFNFDRDVKITDAKLASILNSTNPDLREFKSRGGKLIQYQGWADPGVAPLYSINYYKSVERRMGGLKKTQDFYRLYMVPGMEHGFGGPGPNNFNQQGVAHQNESPQPGEENDIVDALMQWVEHGAAPNKIIATKFKDDDPQKPILTTRPLCPYPKKAMWTGKGNTNDAANFTCKR